MELTECIMGRRSVRDYEGKPVPEEIIKKILKAGAMAPSAMDLQPVKYIVITNKETINELSEKVKDKAGLLGFGARLAEKAKIKKDVIFYGAPLLILLVSENGDWEKTDCALAAENMMLQAYGLGLGSCFIGFANTLNEERETLSRIGLEGSQSLQCALIFGYPKGTPHPKEREAKVQSIIK
jgi:nitroreductase